MIGMALMLMQAVPFPAQSAELHNCPAPRTIILVRCPGPHEITTMTISCKAERKIDDCAQPGDSNVNQPIARVVGQYRLEDVNLYVLEDGKKIRIR